MVTDSSPWLPMKNLPLSLSHDAICFPILGLMSDGAVLEETGSRRRKRCVKRIKKDFREAMRSRLSLHVLRRDDRLQLLFSHFCGTHISLVEDRPGERSPAEIGSLQIRPNQTSLDECSPGEISSLHIRIAEIGLGKISSLQIRPAQISTHEIGFSQPG